MLIFSAAIAPAQVAPAAKVGGYPIAISAGVSDYDIDYGFSRRMEGLVIRGGVHVFHGLGVDVSARSIFMNTPARVTRMQQNTFLAGAYYDAPAIWHLRPFVRYAGGIGTIEFPSRNPNYTRDSFTVYAPSGGVEYLVSPRAAIRAEYEYQSWMKYQGPKQLNPQGWTIGATYYLRGKRMRAHPMD
jgi:opacity protein-like surface antigen